MITQSNGTIYLSEQRGSTQQGNDYQSYHTFNFGSYYDKHKEPIGDLLFVNDETLNTGVKIKTTVKQGNSLLLFPLVGGFEFKGETTGFVEAGQFCLISPEKDVEIELSNPYKTELISFLQIGFGKALTQNQWIVGKFDLESQPNQLIPLEVSAINNPKYLLGSVGIFGGREKSSYRVKNSEAGVFAFVISGVFEVQDRLLQSRDGLAMWDEKEIEFEALSQDAIILFLDLGNNPKS